MDRKQALEELKLRLENENTIKHSLAVEAIMRKLAIQFNEHEDLWGIAGLVHDIDYERVLGDMSQHGKMGADILEALNVDHSIIYAVRAHNPENNIPRRRKIDKALYCADPISGLIIACALIVPSKKLRDIDENFVMKKYHQKAFARSANREQIATCTEIDLTLEGFIKISLEALKEISDELEL